MAKVVIISGSKNDEDFVKLALKLAKEINLDIEYVAYSDYRNLFCFKNYFSIIPFL